MPKDSRLITSQKLERTSSCTFESKLLPKVIVVRNLKGLQITQNLMPITVRKLKKDFKVFIILEAQLSET